MLFRHDLISWIGVVVCLNMEGMRKREGFGRKRKRMASCRSFLNSTPRKVALRHLRIPLPVSEDLPPLRRQNEIPNVLYRAILLSFGSTPARGGLRSSYQ